MQGYRIVCTRPGNAELQRFEVRAPREKEVVVKIDYTLISNGTEKARLMGVTGRDGSEFPFFPGYSGVGTIQMTGQEVRDLKPGDYVFVSHGGHGSYSVQSVSQVVKVPATVKPLDAVYTKMVSFPLHGLRLSRMEIGESVAVIGLGTLCLFGCQMAKIGGALTVVGIGNREKRRSLALDFGADAAVDPQSPSVVEQTLSCIRKQNVSRGADIVLETSGTVAGLNTAMKIASRHGRVILVGSNRNYNEPTNLWDIHVKGLKIIGANASTQSKGESFAGLWTGRRNFNTVLSLIDQGKVRPGLIETLLMNPEDASVVYSELINNREFPLGVVFNWREFG